MQTRLTPIGEFTIATDLASVDIDAVHRFLSLESYWARGIPREVVERSIRHSMPFSVHRVVAGKLAGQVGFARVISDRATFAYIGDVHVDGACRGHGLSKWLMDTIVSHPELQGLRRWMLLTSDAHGLYEQYGFKVAAHPERVMERHFPGLYASAASGSAG